MRGIKKILLRTGLPLIILFFSGCYYDVGPETEPIGDDVIISFSGDVQPIFNKKCTACHPLLVPQLDLGAGLSFNSLYSGGFVVPNNSGQSTLFQRLTGNPTIMPPSGPLPESDVETIKKWIEQGALNN